MGKKSLALKLWLIARRKANRRVPVWVIAKTKMRVRRNPKMRNWRYDKLGTKYYRRIMGDRS